MGKKFHIYVRDDDLVKWLEEQIEKGRFRNASHAFELGLKKLKEEDINI